VTSVPSSDAGLEQQRASIEASFRRGWRVAGDGVLTERWYAEARRILDHGGWTGLAPAVVDAVRQGAARKWEKVWLKEAIETGALDRMMADPPAPDGAGVVWTNWADES
jgi:hypothetical protein